MSKSKRTAWKNRLLGRGDGPESSPPRTKQGPDTAPVSQFSSVSGSKSPQTRPNSLWDQAYQTLKLDPSDSELLQSYSTIVEQELAAAAILDPRGKIYVFETKQKQLEVFVERKLVQIQKTEWPRLRDISEKIVTCVLALKDFVASAASADPHVALAWTGISLFLPLLLNPTEQKQDLLEGLDKITTVVRRYTVVEMQYRQHLKSSQPFQETIVNLYSSVLKYQALVICKLSIHPVKRTLRDSIKADDWKGLLVNIKSQDTECEKYLKLLDSSDLKTGIDKHSHQLGQLANSLEGFREDQRQWRLSDEEQKCLHALSVDDQVLKEKNRNPTRLERTCLWFLDHPNYRSWQENSKNELLWISADPGCGKSVLSKYLVDTELPTSTNSIVLYWFFKDTSDKQRSLSECLLGLLHQLLTAYPRLVHHALKDYRRNGKLRETSSDLWKILVAALNDPDIGDISIVIDALDECKEGERENFVALLAAYHDTAGHGRAGTVKFLITSRPYDDVRDAFHDLIQKFPQVHIAGESYSVAGEIEIVIRKKCVDLASRLKLSENVATALETQLLGMKNQTYLWLKLVWEGVLSLKPSTEKDMLALIHELPDGIVSAYEALLNRCPRREKARIILQIVLGAGRPLTLSEMDIAISTAECDCMSYQKLQLTGTETLKERLRHWCGLFLTVFDSKVYLIHQTAKEFLLAEDTELKTKGWRQSFTMKESHQLLSRICMTNLLFEDFRLRVPRIKTMDEARSKAEGFATDYHLLDYSLNYWASHFAEAQSNTQDEIAIQAKLLYDTTSIIYSFWTSFYWWKIASWRDESPFLDDLVCSSALGHTVVVEALLACIIGDMRLETRGELTPLYWAAVGGHEAVVRLLLARADVDVNRPDDDGRTPLSWAAFEGHEAVVRLLLARADVDVNRPDDDGRTPLYRAASEGHEAMVRLLLARADVDVNRPDDDGWTPLSWAASEGHEAMVRLLLARADVDVNRPVYHGWTPLSRAASEGHEAVVRLLLARADVDVNRPDDDGWTPLSRAAFKGHKAVVRLFEAYNISR